MAEKVIDPVALSLRNIGLREIAAGNTVAGNAMAQAANYIERLRWNILTVRADAMDEAAHHLESSADLASMVHPLLGVALCSHAGAFRALAELDRGNSDLDYGCDGC